MKDKVKDQFPGLQEITYFNNAAQCPVPRKTLAAIEQITEALGRPHVVPDVAGTIKSAKKRLADLINAETGEVTFIPNTSVGISTAAASLPLRRGDEVLTVENEHPTLLYPWLNLRKQGVEIRQVPWGNGRKPTSRLLENVTERTRVIALSHVEWVRGFRHDLQEIGKLCAERGVYLVVDAIQSMGVMPVDVRASHISVLAAGGYKWLMSGRGNGCLFVAKHVAHQMQPTLVGRHGVRKVTGSDQLEFYSDIRRFNTGAWNLPAIVALDSSIELLQQIGLNTITDRVIRRTDTLVDGLEQLGLQVLSCREPEHRSSIVAFSTGDEQGNAELFFHLQDNDVYLARKRGNLRAGIHYFNTYSDVNRLLQVAETVFTK